MVNYELLIRKLENYGVPGMILKRIASYLIGRSAQVKIKSYVSESFEVKSGVLQVLYLGPLLFILFIVNDIKTIGVIRKFCSDFTDCSAILYLHRSLALPILPYVTPAWTPHV